MKKNKRVNPVYLNVLIFLTFFMFLSNGKALAAESLKKHILILQSYDEQHDWEKNLLEGINNVFENNFENYSVDVEYMHMKKYSGEEYSKKLIDFYKYKYGKKNYDVIIVCDNYAFDFIRNHNKQIFKDTPVVFCGVNGYDSKWLEGNKDFTGVAEQADIEGTLEVALKQNKNISEINVLLSRKLVGSIYKKSFEETLMKYTNEYKINIVQLCTMAEVKNWLKSLNKNSIIVLASDLKDDEEYMNYGEVAKFLSSSTDIPIYGLWDFILGNGIVGGSLIESKYHGELAAKLAVRIINGENPENIAVITDTCTQYMFDYNVLKRFDIAGSNIPYNSKIINKPSKKCYVDKRLLTFSTISVIVILCIIIIMLTINILKRKKAELDLEESETQLKTIINSSPNIICFKDKDGKWLEANRATLKVFKIENIDYKGKTSEELAKLTNNEKSTLYNCEKTDLKAWKTEKVYISEEVLKENNDKTYEFIKMPIFQEGKKKAFLVVIGRDITEEKCNQQLMDNANKNQKLLDETLEYDKIKTEFFANISHELKTPLNVIFSTVQLFDLYLNNNQIIENGVNISRNIYILRQNCFRLLRLVNNLIDITKLDSGYFELNLKNRNIINVIEDITLSVAEFIESKDIELIFDTDVEEKLLAFDEDKIERIMLNLLSNAVKFTPKGGVISVNIYDKENTIEIHVKDTGIGIPHDKQKIIFDRFRQVDKSLTRNREGSGIGLSLVKSLVELHNGNIYLESEEGKSSEFTIELPITLVEENEDVTENAMKQSYVERISIEFSDIYL